MTDYQRIEKVLNYLNLNPNQVYKQLGIKTPQVFYDIKAGKCGISKDLANKFQEKYGNINKNWLLTGEGDMLKQPSSNIITNIGDFATNTINGDLSSQLAELISAQKSMQQEYKGMQQEYISLMQEKDRQINELIEIIKQDKSK